MALPRSPEILAAIRGLGLVLRGDPQAPAWYDLSIDGFWRSFWPALIAAGLYFAVLEPSAEDLAAWGSHIGFALGEAGQYLTAWVAYLAVMVLLCRAFHLTGRYAVFVVLYNWAQAIINGVSLPVMLAENWGLLPPGALIGWELALLLLWLYTVAQIARTALGASLMVAVTAAALDLAATILVDRAIGALL
ncbi:MAG TPA: hypothetical protein VF194_00070 [Ferrovibrio sp.]|uniref:hypothetical protein n=1 Tax=Ferrovibrio sp. TaxID=1917215 RepID=UPI002ED2C0A7